METPSDYWRIHLPDGTHRDHNHLGGGQPHPGEQLFPGLIVDRVRPAEAETYTDDGNLLTLEVWLREVVG